MLEKCVELHFSKVTSFKIGTYFKAKNPPKKRASAGGAAGPSRPAKKKPGNCETCGRSPKKKPTAAALAKQARYYTF